MARAPRNAVTKTEDQTTDVAVVDWEAQLAAQAEAAAKQEANTGGGQFFGLRSGILTFNDQPIPGNEMAVIIADSILENVFFEGAYDPDSPAAPTCFAHGRDDNEMAPHASVVAAGQAQNETCAGCPMNEWASADTGRGKACRNTRRLALVSAGTFDKAGNFVPHKADELAAGAIAFMKLPVTSTRAYATFVKQVAGALKRPPHGIVTKIKVVPDAKTQFKVLFEPLGNVPGPLLPVVMKRHEEAKSVIDFPYILGGQAEEVSAKTQARGARASKTPAKAAAGGRRGKY